MSDGVLMWVGLAFFALVFAGLWLILTKARKKRIAQLEAFAASQGWTYVAEDQSLLALSHDEPFGQGHSRTVQDVFNGTTGGHEFVSFQYIYKVTTGSGDQQRLWTWQFEDLGPALIEDRLRFLADTLAAVPTFVWSPR